MVGIGKSFGTDISQQYVLLEQWRFFTFVLLFNLVGVVLVDNERHQGRLLIDLFDPLGQCRRNPIFTAVFTYVFFGFTIIWTVFAFSSLFIEHSKLLAALTDGNAKVLEGAAEYFHPMLLPLLM